MSVRSETYLLYAVDIDRNKITDSNVFYGLFEDLYFSWCGKEVKGKFGLLDDPMGGDYFFAGYCIACANDDGDGFSIYDLENTIYRAGVKEDLAKWLKDNILLDYITDDNPRFVLVTHCH